LLYSERCSEQRDKESERRQWLPEAVIKEPLPNFN